MAVSLPLAILATVAMLLLNEVGYRQSTSAAQSIEEAQSVRRAVGRLMQTILDAETGQRGYLLTGNLSYLAPFERAAAEIEPRLQELQQLMAPYPAERADYAQLADAIKRKQSEITLSIRMYKDGKEDAWRFVLNTDVGKDQMEAIRALSEKMIESSSRKALAARDKIGRTLLLSRIGVAALALGGLMGFYLYLLQTQALLSVSKREQDSLQRERDMLEKQVRERTAKLAELATHLQEVREDERGHLARELHDELGALLTAAKLDVARIRSRLGSNVPEASERLEHLTTTLNSGIALKRRIVEDLRPSSLSHLGLVASLEILAREFAERSGLQIETQLEAVELGGSAQLTVYRLVQEALTNMGKYAQATKAGIEMKNEGKRLTVDVYDDGKGFNASEVPSTSHGIAGMRHRVEAAGGHLTVESSPGKGTRIRAVLPTTR